MATDDFEQMFMDAQYARENWLRGKGWDYSSSYPDCYWRWSKTVKDQRMTCITAEEAVQVQVALDNS